MRIFTLLPWQDWLAIVWFFGSWLTYSWFARHESHKRPSILRATNRYRHFWMLQATGRDPRVLDGIITQNLSSTPSFFSSTTIIIIGGLFALMGTTDRASELVREIPFAVQTSVLIFDLKVLLIIGVFVFAFFRFSWSMRQYTFAALLIGSLPSPQEFDAGKFDRETFAARASEVAVTYPQMALRCGTRSAAQHILLAHELAVVLAHQALPRPVTRVGVIA
jgi:uncharacterized membrane protein